MKEIEINLEELMFDKCQIGGDKFPAFAPGDGSAHSWAFYPDADTAWLWCELDEDFSIEVLSRSPLEHAVDIEAEAVGWNDVLGMSASDVSNMAWALQQGLAYRQPFLIEVSVRYRRHYTQDGEEWDCEVEYGVLWREPLDPSVAASRFQEWLDRPLNPSPLGDSPTLK